jgi:CRP/FNR family transcriptional regulator, cyclic AMP receptor protein
MPSTSEPGTALFRFATDTRVFSAGQTIFREGEAGDHLYVVQQGEVELRVHDRIVAVVGPSGILGEMALIDRKPRSATAVATIDSVLVPVDEAHFLRLVQQTPNFALQVMRVMADRLRKMDALD